MTSFIQFNKYSDDESNDSNDYISMSDEEIIESINQLDDEGLINDDIQSNKRNYYEEESQIEEDNQDIKKPKNESSSSNLKLVQQNKNMSYLPSNDSSKTYCVQFLWRNHKFSYLSFSSRYRLKDML